MNDNKNAKQEEIKNDNLNENKVNDDEVKRTSHGFKIVSRNGNKINNTEDNKKEENTPKASEEAIKSAEDLFKKIADEEERDKHKGASSYKQKLTHKERVLMKRINDDIKQTSMKDPKDEKFSTRANNWCHRHMLVVVVLVAFIFSIVSFLMGVVITVAIYQSSITNLGSSLGLDTAGDYTGETQTVDGWNGQFLSTGLNDYNIDEGTITLGNGQTFKVKDGYNIIEIEDYVPAIAVQRDGAVDEEDIMIIIFVDGQLNTFDDINLTNVNDRGVYVGVYDNETGATTENAMDYIEEIAYTPFNTDVETVEEVVEQPNAADREVIVPVDGE